MISFSSVQAGVGFWLTDFTQVRQLAEQLAKAQFGARRDPHDCTLMYIALGKKMLLQVIYLLLECLCCALSLPSGPPGWAAHASKV